MIGLLYLGILRKWGTAGLNQPRSNGGTHRSRTGPGRLWTLPIGSPVRSLRRWLRIGNLKNITVCLSPGCGGMMRPNGPIPVSHKPEYETVLAFSGMILNGDWDTVMSINDILNRAGMDSISAGGTVAAVIEWYEKGLLSLEDTDGLALNWGNDEALVALIHKMITAGRDWRSLGGWGAGGTEASQY